MKKKRQQKPIEDLIFTFKYSKIDVEFNDENEFTKTEIEKIKNIVKNCSKEIIIDKSYVVSKDHKYQKTFIKEEGWKELCKLVFKTKFGNKCSIQDNAIMFESYKLLIFHYLYQILQDYDIDTENIILKIKENTRFMVLMEVDDLKTWKKYPGKWQIWKHI